MTTTSFPHIFHIYSQQINHVNSRKVQSDLVHPNYRNPAIRCKTAMNRFLPIHFIPLLETDMSNEQKKKR